MVFLIRRRDGSEFKVHIDQEDAHLVHEYRWRVVLDKTTGRFYVHSNKCGFLHRAITQATAEEQVDHWNHDTLDNRRTNLRRCTPSINQLNRAGAQKNNLLGMRGVYCRNGRYEARVKVSGKQRNLGTFASPESAAAVVRNEVRRLLNQEGAE